MTKPFQRIITLDFETYYAQDYSLRNKDLNTSEYVRHPSFKAQCVGIKIDDQPAIWVRDHNVAAALRTIDWSTSALLAHHAAFDGLILSHHYRIIPAYYLDTLSMARALHSNGIGASLDTVAQFYGLGNKVPDVLDKTKGVRDLSDEVMNALGMYCGVDAELCRMIFDKMIEGFPQDELDLIDLTIRMFCDPVLQIDIPRVEVALKEEQDERAALIAATGIPIKELSSSDKFAAHLANLIGDDCVPYKTSPTTGKLTYAFSKQDLGFLELKEHHDTRVRSLVAGRLAAKSTIGESRAMRFLAVGADGKKLPVYLNYYGAHTGRWSAGNKMNLQNLKRGGELRRSIIAPEGHVIVVADSAQIEARVTAWLARDQELLDLFAEGADVYKHMAGQIYQIDPDSVTKDQRFIGKIAVLGLGYGMGWKKFQHTLATGAMGPAVELSDDECQRIVRMYRTARYKITTLWKDLELVLYKMVIKRPGEFGPLRHDDAYKVWMPNGLYLNYPFLTADIDNEERLTNYRYYDYQTGVARSMGLDTTKNSHKIYGGLFTENVVQALSRIIVGAQMMDISRYLKERDGIDGMRRKVVSMTHDEVICVVPENEADQTLDYMVSAMRKPPMWCSGIPLNAEGGFARDYSK